MFPSEAVSFAMAAFNRILSIVWLWAVVASVGSGLFVSVGAAYAGCSSTACPNVVPPPALPTSSLLPQALPAQGHVFDDPSKAQEMIERCKQLQKENPNANLSDCPTEQQ
jgi:hypothetical protein